MEVAEEEEGVEAVAAEVLGEAGEARAARDVNPWLSLPQSWGQAVFHERHEVP